MPYRLLFPAILVLCCIGIYSLNNSATEVGLAALFGLLGYVFIKLGCEPAPLLLAMVLGPMMEDELRRGDDHLIAAIRPCSCAALSASPCCVLAALLLLLVVVPAVRRKREEAFQEVLNR